MQFNVAVDRRDKLERATNIELLEESFLVSGEKRETGVVAALKEGYGFIRCAERDARVFFHFSEVITLDEEIDINTEVEITISQVIHLFCLFFTLLNFMHSKNQITCKASLNEEKISHSSTPSGFDAFRKLFE